jgi:hypothetical protein
VALEHYVLAFGVDWPTKVPRRYRYPGRIDEPFARPALIYVNWDCDIICLMGLGLLKEDKLVYDFIDAKNNAVKRLALADHMHYLFEIHHSCLMKDFNHEEVILYPGHQCGYKFEPEYPMSYSFRELETIPDCEISDCYALAPAKVEKDLQEAEQRALKEMEPFEKRPALKLMLMKDKHIKGDDEDEEYY